MDKKGSLKKFFAGTDIFENAASHINQMKQEIAERDNRPESLEFKSLDNNSELLKIISGLKQSNKSLHDQKELYKQKFYEKNEENAQLKAQFKKLYDVVADFLNDYDNDTAYNYLVDVFQSFDADKSEEK